MTTTQPLVTGPATAAVPRSVLTAGTATRGRIVIGNNCGKAVSTTIHHTRKVDCGRKGVGALAIR